MAETRSSSALGNWLTQYQFSPSRASHPTHPCTASNGPIPETASASNANARPRPAPSNPTTFPDGIDRL